MKKIFWILMLFCFCTSTALQGQILSYGFKTGLSWSSYLGDNTQFESFDNRLGFHLGVIVKYKVTDIFGVSAELLYSQKGMSYQYDGNSFFLVQRPTGSEVLLEGIRKMDVTVANDFLDVPVNAYVRAGPFEFSAGLNIGILVGSSAGGQFDFTGTRPPTELLDFNLDHRYFGQEPGEAVGPNFVTALLGGEQIAVALQHGAYFEYEKKDGNRYRGIDLGLNAGISFYLNDGLFLGLRANYGLIDATREQMDIRYDQFSGNYPSFQNDKDRTFALQLSLGFAF